MPQARQATREDGEAVRRSDRAQRERQEGRRRDGAASIAASNSGLWVTGRGGGGGACGNGRRRLTRLPIALIIASLLANCSSSTTGRGDGTESSEGRNLPNGELSVPEATDDTPIITDPDMPAQAVGDPTNSGCLRDRVQIPSDEDCQCSCSDCECTEIECVCDNRCYGDEDCIITADTVGNGETGSGWSPSCGKVDCVPESDLTTELVCSIQDCEFTPEVAQLTPSLQGSATQEQFERQVQQPGVLFVVDNSKSMADDQLNVACAVDSFFETANAGDAAHRTGVLSTDMFYDDGDYGYPSKRTIVEPMYGRQGTYRQPPRLLTLSGGSCDTRSVPACQCGAMVTDPDAISAACTAVSGGGWLDSADSSGKQRLKDLIVRGDDGSLKEGGLEKAFQFFAQMERQGTFEGSGPYEVVVISDEDAEADYFCDDDRTFDAVDRNTASIPNFRPPRPTNTVASCRQDLIDFYVYYFTSRGIIVHGLNYAPGCPDFDNMGQKDPPITYQAVIEATQGYTESICACDRFSSFFAQVGSSTASLSTGLCLKTPVVDPALIKVFYTEGATQQPVPASAWTLNTQTQCIVLGGEWTTKYGSYIVEVTDKNAPGETSRMCLPPRVDPLVSSIQLTCEGTAVPQGKPDGWTFDPADDCFTLHGAAAALSGPCDVSYH